MELSQGTNKKSKFTSEENFIGKIPDHVVTNILDRLPLQDVVKTSILSRDWRFKWTLLTQLVFDWNFFEYLLERQRGNSYGEIISRFLHHCAMITKFFLYIEGENNCMLDDEDINRWMLFLSGKRIEDLTLYKEFGEQFRLHAHFFSCLELKKLVLENCSFDLPVSFHGFPNLLKLELSIVNLEGGKFGEFIMQCPLLEILTMSFQCKVKLVEFAKLTNLKKLTLCTDNLENSMNITSDTISTLVGYLPKLQELCLDFTGCKVKEGGGEKRFTTTFPCLKTLKLSRIDLPIEMNLSRAFEIINNFPDLHTLKISLSSVGINPTVGIDFPDVDYNKTGLLELRSVVLKRFKDSDGDVRFIKYLLACSPFLEKLVILPHESVVYDEKLTFAKKLLKLHRASPIVNIDLHD